MATLISVYGSDGCEGRCDAKCYDAKCPDCECICGGVNHGVGLKKAGENTRELAEKWIDGFEAEHGPSETTKAVRARIDAERDQLVLM